MVKEPGSVDQLPLPTDLVTLLRGGGQASNRAALEYKELCVRDGSASPQMAAGSGVRKG